jgi:hypothetical protein
MRGQVAVEEVSRSLTIGLALDALGKSENLIAYGSSYATPAMDTEIDPIKHRSRDAAPAPMIERNARRSPPRSASA